MPEKGPQDGLKLTGTRQLLLYADYVNLSCEKRNKALLVASREIGLEINAEQTKVHVHGLVNRTQDNMATYKTVKCIATLQVWQKSNT
jgi:hypothetical protein